MKKLVLLIASVFTALLLTACGDKAEKKVETQSTTTVEQPSDNQGADTGKTTESSTETTTEHNQ